MELYRRANINQKDTVLLRLQLKTDRLFNSPILGMIWILSCKRHLVHIADCWGALMDSSPQRQNSSSAREKQSPIATIKALGRPQLRPQKSPKHLSGPRSRGGQARSRQGCTIILSELSPCHIAAAALLPLSVACAVGAILSLAFGALGLFPVPIAAELFLKSAGGNAVLGLVCALIGRSWRK
jgi:hypothetical protein